METVTIDNNKPRRPGIVIFAAVLHFFGVALFGFLSLFCVLAMAFGAAWGVDQYFREQMSQANLTYGMAVIFILALTVFLSFTAFFLALALGLLKAKKYAWYVQVALSTLSLLSLPLGLMGAFVMPVGAVIHIVILAMFFGRPVRAFFKV
jgi:hypothetical protein